MITEKLLLPEEVGELLHVSKKTVLQWGREGLLRPISFKGRRVLFCESEIVEVMKNGFPQSRPERKLIPQSRYASVNASKGNWE